jgi:hypothetical protein
MAGTGRPLGFTTEKWFGTALREEIAAAGGKHKVLRRIARNLLDLASKPDISALPAIREIGDRLDGKPKQETEVSLRTAVARELTDDDLAAIAVGASLADEKMKEIRPDPPANKSELN